MTEPVFNIREDGPWVHGNLSVSGISLHTVTAGDDLERHTVILLHDFPMHWWSWREQIVDLSEAGYRVIALDQRGFGDSDMQPGTADLALLAGDVIGVTHATGTTSYTVVGSGLGGAVAWMMAHMAPAGLVSAVAVCAPHPLTRYPRSASGAIAAGRIDRELGVPYFRNRRLRNGILVDGVLRSWGAPASMAHLREVAGAYKSTMRRTFAANAALETFRAARNPSGASKKLMETPVSVPVWSVSAGRDGRVPPAAYVNDSRHSRGPVTRVEIEESGHFPNEETPKALTRILKQHLATIGK